MYGCIYSSHSKDFARITHTYAHTHTHTHTHTYTLTLTLAVTVLHGHEVIHTLFQ